MSVNRLIPCSVALMTVAAFLFIVMYLLCIGGNHLHFHFLLL